MITSLTVGAVFEITDRASATLAALATQVERLDLAVRNAQRNLSEMAGIRMGGLSRSMETVERRMTAIATGSERMAVAFAASMEAMTASLVVATERMAAMAAEMAGISRMARAAGAGGATGGGGGRGGAAAAAGHGGLYARFHQGPVGGHSAIGAGGAAALGVGAGMFLGMRGAAEQQLSLMYTLQHANVPINTPEGRREYAELQKIAEETSRGTIFSNVATAKMMPSVVALSQLPLSQAKPLMSTSILFGEYEELMGKSMGKHWSATENAAGALRYAHLMNQFEPGGLETALNKFVPLTMMTGQSPTSLENTMKYSIDTGRSMGIEPGKTAELTALLSILGMSGSTAGTGLRQGLLGLLPRGGSGFGQRTGPAEKARRDLLQKMGFIDGKGQSRLVHDGEFDVTQMISLLHNWEVAHPTTFMQDLTRVSNTRGAAALARIGAPGVVDRWENLQSMTAGFVERGGYRSAQSELAQNSVWQQVEQIGSNLYSTLVLLNQSMGGTLAVLRGLNSGLNSFRGYLSDHPVAAQFGQTAMGVGGAYAGYRVLGMGARMLGLGAGAAAGGAAGGAAAGGGAAGILAGGAAMAARFGRFAGFAGRFAMLTAVVQLAMDTAELGAQGALDKWAAMGNSLNKFIESKFGPSKFWPTSPTAPEGGESMIGDADHAKRMRTLGFDAPHPWKFGGGRVLPRQAPAPHAATGVVPYPHPWWDPASWGRGEEVMFPKLPLAKLPGLEPDRQSIQYKMWHDTRPPPPVPGVGGAGGGTTIYQTNNLTIQGVTMQEIVAKVVAALKGLISTALPHNSGPGAGPAESMYTTGGAAAIPP